MLLDSGTAAESGYRLGDEVSLITSTAQPRLERTFVGTAEFGGTSLVGASVVMFSPADAQEVYLGGEDAWSQIWVTAAAGTSQDDLKAAVDEVVPEGYESTTGAAACWCPSTGSPTWRSPWPTSAGWASTPAPRGSLKG